MRILIDKFIEFLKWPVAVYMLFTLPACIRSFYYFDFKTLKYLALIAGFVLFYFSRSMADSNVRTNIQIIAHECTHAFFALITFHKITKIRVEGDNSGGNMEFKGRGNWLIIIAPYFFPLFCFFCMIGISIYTLFAPMNLFLNGILGYFAGYHLDTVVSQIHEKQTDLPKVSYKFCVMFLPGANLWALGCILAFNSRGWEGIWLYQYLINMLNSQNYRYAVQYLGSLF